MAGNHNPGKAVVHREVVLPGQERVRTDTEREDIERAGSLAGTHAAGMHHRPAGSSAGSADMKSEEAALLKRTEPDYRAVMTD